MSNHPYTIAQVMANLQIMANAGDSDSITWSRDVAADICARGICPSPDEVLVFHAPAWSEYAGEHGGYVARSKCGNYEAIAEPLRDVNRWQFWLVRVDDGETIAEARV